jgi:hypothetical protein
MRMRKLGKGQSVMFCGPMEVERSIAKCCGDVGDHIEVADVLRWSIQETYLHTKKCIPLWATQGIRYQPRNIAWAESVGNAAKGFPQNLAESLLEPEARSLQERYKIGGCSLEDDVLFGDTDNALASREDQLDAIRDKCRQFDIGTFDSASLQEEQERELSPENEREQQVERPPALEPRKHSTSASVKRFAETGALNPASSSIQPAYKPLCQATVGRSLELDP